MHIFQMHFLGVCCIFHRSRRLFAEDIHLLPQIETKFRIPVTLSLSQYPCVWLKIYHVTRRLCIVLRDVLSAMH
jgi:hypothetical protein